MKSKKGKIFLASVVGLVLFGGIAVGATFALFSDSSTINSHVEAGTLELGFTRTKLSGTKLNADGKLEDFEDSNPVDLKESQEDIFTFDEVVPTLYQEATLKVDNLGTLAFDYSIKFDATEGAETALANQLEVTVTQGETEVKKDTLARVLAEDSYIPLGSLDAGGSADFVVKIEFLDTADNNSAKNTTLSFDFTLYCEQATK